MMEFKSLNKEVVNSALVGLTFMLLYSAFYTLSNLEKLILHSVKNEDMSYSGDGFISLSVLYVSFALFMWFVPAVMALTGPKHALTIGAVGFSLFLASMLPEQGWLLYLGSVFNGIGAAILWTSQGVYIILNSTATTITRNIAIFSGLCHSSMLYGNLFVYFTFEGKLTIDRPIRVLIYSVLLGLTIAALVVATALPRPAHADDHSTTMGSAWQEMRKSWAIAKTKHMIILYPMFFYCGLQISYLSGVFGAAVGFTKYSDGFSSNQLVAVTGFFTGIGEILAEVFLVVINPRLTSRPWLRSVIVGLGMLTECTAYLLSFLNFSNSSVFGPTTETTAFPSSSRIAVVIAILLGFSDGIFMPMLISLMGKLYPNGSASALTVYIFLFSLASAVSFFYSSYFGLHWQLLILGVEGIVGALCYCYVNRSVWSK